MAYVTSIERLARREGQREGLRQGIESLLRVRFSDEGQKLMPEIRAINEDEKLEAILQTLKTATSLDEVRRLWKPETS